MKKRIVSGWLAMVMLCGLVMMSGMPAVKASEGNPATEIFGPAEGIHSARAIADGTMGEHLQTGYSKIRLMAPRVIMTGGTTIAEHTCNSVQVTVSVERYDPDDDEWYVVDVWHKENNNTYLVSSNKKLEVEGGYYYRVTCIHSADGDMSSSTTNGMYVE